MGRVIVDARHDWVPVGSGVDVRRDDRVMADLQNH
jgi:hypothetical protein